MGLPKKLKNFALFMDGVNYVGQVPEVTLPKLAIKLEDYQSGGMVGPIKLDHGIEALECEFTAAGFLREVLAQFGALAHDAVLLRFAGALQRDDAEEITALEIVMRGRHAEVDMGSAKSGEKTEFKVKSALSYYKLSMDGQAVIEIDMVNLVMVVDGVDRLADIRAALGI